MGEEPQSLWCVACGAEHSTWAAECAFCGGELSVSPLAEVVVDHSMSELDVSALDSHERSHLVWLLTADGTPHELTGATLRFPSACEGLVLEALGEVADDADGAPPEENDGADPADVSAEAADVVVVASTGRRFAARLVGWFLWWLLAAVLLVVAAVSGAIDGVRYLPLLEVLVLIEVAFVAMFGWDVGKLVLRLRVVDAHDRPPGWGRSMKRAAVLWGPVLVGGWSAWLLAHVSTVLATALAWVGPAWLLAVVWSIAAGPERRGRHDRAAGTWVLDVRDETWTERARRLAHAQNAKGSTSSQRQLRRGPSREGGSP